VCARTGFRRRGPLSVTVMIYKEQALALERGLFGERRANSVWERELKQNVNVYRN